MSGDDLLDQRVKSREKFASKLSCWDDRSYEKGSAGGTSRTSGRRRYHLALRLLSPNCVQWTLRRNRTSISPHPSLAHLATAQKVLLTRTPAEAKNRLGRTKDILVVQEVMSCISQ